MIDAQLIARIKVSLPRISGSLPIILFVSTVPRRSPHDVADLAVRLHAVYNSNITVSGGFYCTQVTITSDGLVSDLQNNEVFQRITHNACLLF